MGDSLHLLSLHTVSSNKADRLVLDTANTVLPKKRALHCISSVRRLARFAQNNHYEGLRYSSSYPILGRVAQGLATMRRGIDACSNLSWCRRTDHGLIRVVCVL
jgi:hypothetical protein